MILAINLRFETATSADFEYLYALCDATMRTYVEAVFGDCFEAIARPTITTLLTQELFQKVYVNNICVGAIAAVQHATHFQLEELYLDPAHQNRGIGTMLMKQLIAQSIVLGKSIRLNVLASNPARTFYERLGFSITSTTQAIYSMERSHQLLLENEVL